MPSSEEFKSKKPSYTLLLNSHFGGGKTYAAMTFPKCYVIGCDPSGLDILYQEQNKHLLDNLVHYEYVHNASAKDLKALFGETIRKPEEIQKIVARPTNERKVLEDWPSIYEIVWHARKMAAAGEIETIILDGLTYLVQMKWHQINEFEEVKSPTTEKLDTQAMYKNLNLWLQRFIASDLITMATRSNCNVIMTCHLKRLSEDEVQGSRDKKTGRHRPGRIIQETDVAPQIEGGFRNIVEGIPGASIYLETRIATADNNQGVKAGDTLFKAICRPAVGLNTIVNAKNRYGLPARIDLTNKSLYEALVEHGNKKALVEVAK